jgi:hypothetical protein
VRFPAVIICLFVAGCGSVVESPWQNAPADQRLDASIPTDAGVVIAPADTGGPTTSCQGNDDCWFGEGCYAQRCIDLLLLESDYERRPVTNDWHRVTVQVVDRELEWSNAADVAWSMEFRDGTLWTMIDCPYGVQELVLDSDEQGISGIWFLSELYQRVD